MSGVAEICVMAIVESYNTAIITSKNDVDDDQRFQIAVKHGIYLVLALETQETNMLFFFPKYE